MNSLAVRHAPSCLLCGYPGGTVCDQCLDWQRVASYAEAAIEFNEQRTARDMTRTAVPLPPAVPLLRDA
jgi:hypothetical protein